MKKKFLGLSDDGFRVFTMWTPGEKGDCGIAMTVGYRGGEFKVYESEAWNEANEQAEERSAQAAADDMRDVIALLKASSTGRYSYYVPGIRQRSNLPQIHNMPIVKYDNKVLFDDVYEIKTVKSSDNTQQDQPKRKPQPNRGPIGRKDWK